MIILLGIYYLTPWIRWDRGPHAPDQAILIDMANRRAYFFFIEIWPQEVYYLTGLLILAAVGLFFATSMLGRVWCGYACPQTVWTDLFVWVERIIQGDRNNRMRIDQLPLTNFEKIWKKLATHFVWLIIGVCTGGAWVFYFSDAPTLFDQIIHFNVPWSVGGWILALTFSTYLMAGYAREQVCIYMCPYSRFQSAMFDRDTLIITYDKERGEPRGKHKKGDSWEGKGHCIDCDSCVVVCPMGIDIREGLQYQCISCGLCVDACNNVMEKLELPKGLIRYDTDNNIKARVAAKSRGEQYIDKLRLLRPRTIYYGVILSFVGGVMLYSLLNRAMVELHVIHDRNPLYVALSDGSIRNTYTIKILNKSHEDKLYSIDVKGVHKKELKIEGAMDICLGQLQVYADSVAQYRVMVSADADAKEPRKDVVFTIKDKDSNLVASTESLFVSGK